MSTNPFPCPVEGCTHKGFKSEKGLDNHLKKVHLWTDKQIWENIKKDYIEPLEKPPIPKDGSPGTDEAQTSDTEGSPPPFNPEEFKKQIIASMIKELGNFAANMDARLKPLEEFQGLLDKTLKGAPNPQATPAGTPQKPQTANPGQLGELADLARAFGLVEGPKTGLSNLAETLSTARLIANAMNPPSPWDRVQDTVMIRMLSRQAYLTPEEAKKLSKDLGIE